MTEVLKIERECDGALAILTLDRPEAMNALSRELRSALGSAFAALAGDAQVVILTGRGRGSRAGPSW